MKIRETQEKYQAYQKKLREETARLQQEKAAWEQMAGQNPAKKDIFIRQMAAVEHELRGVRIQYDENQQVIDRLNEEYYLSLRWEDMKKQSEAAGKQAEDQAKIMEVARRIAKGDIVPPEDEKRLMEYSMELYLASKNAAMLAGQKEKEKHDSLWEEEENQVMAEPEVSEEA